MMARVLMLAAVGMSLVMALAAAPEAFRPAAQAASACAPTAAGTVAATPPSDLFAGFPGRPRASVLAVDHLSAVPTGPVRVVFEQVPLPPLATTNVVQTAGPEVFAVEAGNLVVVTQCGERRYPRGAQVALEQGALYGLRNDDATQPASYLRLALIPQAQAAAARRASGAPVLEALSDRPPDITPVVPTPSGPAAAVRFETVVDHLPAPPALLFIAEVTWPPHGPAPGRSTADGAVGLTVASGSLTITAGSQPDQVLGPGECIALPAGTSHAERNDGSDPARAFLLGVVGDPKRGGFATPVAGGAAASDAAPKAGSCAPRRPSP